MEQALFRSRFDTQKLNTYVQKLPSNSILLGVLKSLESEFQRRGLTQRTGHPLWFLAETERNVFLWRNGYSLENVKDFEFWIEPEKLINKRLLQLENPGIGNPFVNTGYASESSNPDVLQQEVDYLEDLSSRLVKIIEHAHALSIAGSETLRDIAPTLYAPKEKVLLPSLKARSNMAKIP
jgi:hypothetical protein